jgi:hypothetical protein
LSAVGKGSEATCGGLKRGDDENQLNKNYVHSTGTYGHHFLVWGPRDMLPCVGRGGGVFSLLSVSSSFSSSEELASVPVTGGEATGGDAGLYCGDIEPVLDDDALLADEVLEDDEELRDLFEEEPFFADASSAIGDLGCWCSSSSSLFSSRSASGTSSHI